MSEKVGATDEMQPKMKTRYGPRYDYRTNPSLRQALEIVLKGGAINKAVYRTGLCHNTIKKYYAMYLADPNIIKNNPKSCTTQEVKEFLALKNKAHDIFTENEEANLIEYFNQFSYLFYGLSEKECRILAYQMAVNNKLELPVDWKNGMADPEWPQFFKGKYSGLNLEKPDRCTVKIMRSIVCEKKNVNDFFDDLERIVHSNPVFKDSSRIFSLDEVYIDTNFKMFSKLPLNECKGDIITLSCIVSASGISVPPIKIEPPSVEDPPDVEIAPGAVSLTAAGGRMQADSFPLVIQHFVEHSKSSPNNPSILIMDTHLCHLSISAIDLAIKSGVHILTVHPHTSKLLLPLTMVLFDLFRKNYNSYLMPWLVKPCSPESEDPIHCITDFIAKAYVKTMTAENIINAFSKCGIVPFDRDLFTDEDYQSCLIPDPPCAECKVRDDRIRRPQPDSEVVIDKSCDTPVAGTSKEAVTTGTENTAGSAEAVAPKVYKPLQSTA